MKVSKNFDIREFVPPSIWNKWGEKSIWFIRPEVISLHQFYRDYFGKSVRINNWHYGGKLSLRGFRPPSVTIGAKLSQHRFGNAGDCDIDGMSANEVRAAIMEKPEKFMAAGLTTLESGAIAKTWVHSDLRQTNLDKILIVGG